MIHPSAIVDESAVVDASCDIGPFCVIGSDVEIGAGTKVRSHAVVQGPTSIGKNNTIYQFASVGEAPQDLKYAGEPTRLVLGDNNIIREYVTLHRGTTGGGGVTTIGNDNLFMASTHVAHDCVVGNGTIFSNAASIAGHVVVGDQVILGGFTCVHQFTHIGAHSFSGLGTVINRDVPPYVLVAGNHARAFSINKKGLLRRGFEKATVDALHKAFRLLIKSRAGREIALEQLAPLITQFSEVREFVDFVTSSERSVVR